MVVQPGVTEIGRRGLDLDGWGDLSVWGWDSQAGTLFAQLWRDRPDDDEDEDEDDERPDVWITPPAWEATGQPTVLAGWIAEATGRPMVAVLRAMAASVPGRVGEALIAQVPQR
jgi:hypothetical protein